MPQLLYTLYTIEAIKQNIGLLFVGALGIILFWQFWKRQAVYINPLRAYSFLILIVFCFLYVMLGNLSARGLFYYCALPLLAFMSGWVTVEASKFPMQKVIKYTLYCMLVGFAIHAFLNWKINAGNIRYQLIDYFTGQIRAATGSGSMNTLIFSLIAYLMVVEKNIKIKILGAVIFLISMRYAFLLGSRTQFIIFLIVSISFLFLYLAEKHSRAVLFRFVLVVCILGGIGVFLYHFNILNLHTYIDNSNLMARYENMYALEDSDQYRYNSISRGFVLTFLHPLGGLRNVGYYHNFWLDIGRISGIIPMGLMFLYSIIINWHVFLIIRNKKIEDWFRYLLFCTYLGIQLNFSTEPILEGVFNFFLCFTIINGMVECYYYRIYLKQNSIKEKSKHENCIFI